MEKLTTVAIDATYDLLLIYGAEDHEINMNEIKAFLSSTTTPVTLLLDNPTVDQAVNMMNVGVAGVVDWQDLDHVIELINRTITSQPAVTTETIYQDIVDQQTELICRYDHELRYCLRIVPIVSGRDFLLKNSSVHHLQKKS